MEVGIKYACAAPTSVTISSITSDSANISFVAAGSSFIIEYGIHGFIPGTGPSAGGGSTVSSTSSPVIVNNLAGGTVYDVYVRQVCPGPEYSSNSAVVQFTSLPSSGLVYNENFDSVTAPAVPSTVTVQNINGGNTWRTVGTDYYVSAPNCLRLDYEEDGTTASNDWFFTTGLNLVAGNSYRLSFQYRNSDRTVWTEKLEVKYGTAADAGSMTTGTLFSNGNINFNMWREGGADFTAPASGTYYIGFHGFSAANNAFVAIDDIMVQGTPDCPPPIGVTIGPVTSGTATVNFSGTGSSYIVEYGVSGFSPGVDENPGAGGTVVAATSSPVLLSGLNTTDLYDVYVRQVCSGSVYGANSSVVSFRTTVQNDNAATATSIVLGAGCANQPFTNVGASSSPGEPFPSCSGVTGYATVWFKFVAPSSGAVRLSTAAGDGSNTLTDSRIALFATTDSNDYSKFQIIGCDEDNGSAPFDKMSVLYATGLTPGTAYYVEVDASGGTSATGTFCLTVAELDNTMLAATANCSAAQALVGDIDSYAGWASLVDASGRLIALIQNPAGARVSRYTASQSVYSRSTPRLDTLSNERYLSRNYNLAGGVSLQNATVKLFFLDDELSQLRSYDSAAVLANLQVTRQEGPCHVDFLPVAGLSFEQLQTGNGTANGVSWVSFTSAGEGNMYLHSTRGELVVKVFLQGAYSSGVARHKPVSATWAGILNSKALNQPYNTTAFGNYNGTESVPGGFFVATGNTTDVLDWVLIELKNASNALVARRAAFVRVDGQVVDLDGISPVTFSALPRGQYYITVRHRNHLGISTQNLVSVETKALGVASSTSANFDFTSAADGEIYGSALAYKIAAGRNVMIGGNANSNSNVRYGGLSSDVSSISQFLGSLAAVVGNQYSSNDVNMDGTVRYGGLNNDVSLIQSTVLGGVITTVISEQKR